MDVVSNRFFIQHEFEVSSPLPGPRQADDNVNAGLVTAASRTEARRETSSWYRVGNMDICTYIFALHLP